MKTKSNVVVLTDAELKSIQGGEKFPYNNIPVEPSTMPPLAEPPPIVLTQTPKP